MSVDPQRESGLPWTGERYVPQIAGEIQLEHVHRYLVASEYGKGKDVLDIACGEGFGSAILANSARSVVGVDIAAEAVEHAARRYRLDNVQFRKGSCVAIPLENDTIDLVVSFETIEHHDEHKGMMAEIKRVLRPGGLVIISSPDRKEYSILPNYRNPYHVRELFKEEFEDLLRAYFKNLEIITQRIVYGSGILSEKGGPFIDYHLNDTSLPHRGLARGLYIIALASDEDLPVVTGGLLEQKVEESEIVTTQAKVVTQLGDEVRQLEEQLQTQSIESAEETRQLKEKSADEVRQLEALLQTQSTESTNKVRQLEAQFVHLNHALREARRSIQSIKSSLSWKTTWPFRVVWDASAAIRSKIKGSDNSSSNAARAAEAGSDVHAISLANLIGASEFFDAAIYEGTAEARAQGLDPALHYVLVGERRGLRPSPAFDPGYYAERYPDIAASGESRLGHYLEMGRAEGRRALPIADTLTFSLAGIKPSLPTVLLLVHVASRTGAPILGWNIARTLRSQVNVIAILLRGGPLESAFAETAVTVKCADEDELDLSEATEGSRLARRLTEIYRPLYVIANSVETRSLAVGLADEGVPVVALVHEFSSYTKPSGTLQLLYERAAEIVFSADIVRRSSEIDYPILSLRRTRVLPQGPSEVPLSRKPARESEETEADQTAGNRLRPEGAEDDLVVVGMGFVDWRKGVDLFIAAGTSILARQPKAPVRFIWIGQGYGSKSAIEISSYLSEQITRSGLADRFVLMDAVEEVEKIYNEADVLFLSSRLDPLPNVSIDAALRGIPVVCFAEASGMADLLASHEETRELVVPHLDAGAAGALIESLAADGEKLRRLGEAVRELARGRFDMAAYVAELDRLGRLGSETAKQAEADAATILTAGAFDLPLYVGDRAPFTELSAAVRHYTALSGKIDYERAPVSGVYTRRPLAGFHPRAYALQSPDYDARVGRDPLAHYLAAGRPKGPWEHPVFRFEGAEARPLVPLNSAGFRVVLHGHFHYTNHIGDFMRAVAANAQDCELILTTASADKAAEIRAAVRKGGAEADIRVVPNRGRDIGPFLVLLKELIGHCDLLGHVHGKRSTHVDIDFGERWRIFLWQHLIGDEMPMIDIIKQAFIDDPTLGLVFPEDPYLVGWEQNLGIAEELAARMRLQAPLPTSINFPVGTMFWARPKALAPLLRLQLALDEYSPEPVPIDGTILHALERLLPIVGEETGYHYATTYLPQFVR